MAEGLTRWQERRNANTPATKPAVKKKAAKPKAKKETS